VVKKLDVIKIYEIAESGNSGCKPGSMLIYENIKRGARVCFLGKVRLSRWQNAYSISQSHRV